MTEPVEYEKNGKLKKSNWWWPAEAVASSLAVAVVVAFRGCWHSQMSWPASVQGHSYQVCLRCGAKRLFDEQTFSGYGPFRYDLNELISPGNTKKRKSQRMEDFPHPML
jgi:hypothetical protein